MLDLSNLRLGKGTADPTEAPEGYEAVKAKGYGDGCTGCFYNRGPDVGCWQVPYLVSCISSGRKDKTMVKFKKKEVAAC